MKKTLFACAAVCAIFSFSVSALAVDDNEYWFFDGSTWVYDYAAYEAALAAEQARKASEAPQDDLLTDAPAVPHNVQESAGVRDVGQKPVSDGSPIDSGYPVGSYVDEAGNVFSSDGELLSPGTTPAAISGDERPVEAAVLDTPASTAVPPSETDAPVYNVADLRGAGDPAVSADAGLKGLIVSVFGSYEPVTEETVITETIDGATVETTIRTVVPGLAGVDFQWVGSVLLFGLLLLGLSKLLGGVVS